MMPHTPAVRTEGDKLRLSSVSVISAVYRMICI